MINEDISKATESIEKNVAEDIYGYLMAIMNGTSYSARKSGVNFGAVLGNAFGKTLVRAVDMLLDDMGSRDR